MSKHSVYAAWCEVQHGSPCSLNSLKVAVGEPVWLKTSDDLASIPSLLDEAHLQSLSGLWVLACVPYEAAPAFDSALKVSASGSSMTTVVGFRPEQVMSWSEFHSLSAKELIANTLEAWTPWLNEHGQGWFDESFDQVKDWIESGDFYQINLTTRLRASITMKVPNADLALLDRLDRCELFPLFLKLFEAQPASFSMFLRLPQQTILSLSPELFFKWDKGRIVTSPMKGTRRPDAESPQLADSSKDRAENLMIVDLLRNDMARVCLPRSVQVESLFDVMALPSVEQMTSTISGLTRPGIRVSDVFGALFPCGSVTGAPKAQSMKRIATLEKSPRGVYCGALGRFKPGGAMRFSVPIRTLSASGVKNSEQSELEYGVGSGLTWYSNRQDEHKEWWQKTVFLRETTVDFDVLETVRLESQQWHNMELHLRRMRDSAGYFSYFWNESQIRLSLKQASLDAEKLKGKAADVFRGRWLLSAEGNFQVQLFPLDNPVESASGRIRLALADRPIEEALVQQGLAFECFSPFIDHKTTYRPHYDAFSANSDVADAPFDRLLYNWDGYLTETCRFNLVVQKGSICQTPLISTRNQVNNEVNNGAKLLNGVLRQRLLSENRIQEYPLRIGDLAHADGIWLINSLRGWVRVDEIVNQRGELIFPVPQS